jgi:hypothetical protein
MTKNRAFPSVCLGAFVAAVFAAPPAHAQPQSYPLVCRGGGSLFQLNVDVGRSDKSNLTISFKGASAGASARAPQRGECAWLDRGWRGGEPQIMTWAGDVDSLGLAFSPDGKLSSVKTLRAGPQGAQLKYLLDALRNGTSFQVHAYRDNARSGQSFLRITRVGP